MRLKIAYSSKNNVYSSKNRLTSSKNNMIHLLRIARKPNLKANLLAIWTKNSLAPSRLLKIKWEIWTKNSQHFV